MTPTWVHFDKRLSPPACPGGGYISLSLGSRGVYVLILQDALNAVGTTGSGLDGIFGEKTRDAVVRYQQANGLGADGMVGCATWRSLTDKANGIGKTATVVMP
jgi:peptidoglycan hydrolase-like protein with peptidoglycan-binding domain